MRASICQRCSDTPVASRKLRPNCAGDKRAKKPFDPKKGVGAAVVKVHEEGVARRASADAQRGQVAAGDERQRPDQQVDHDRRRLGCLDVPRDPDPECREPERRVRPQLDRAPDDAGGADPRQTDDRREAEPERQIRSARSPARSIWRRPT